MNINNIDMHIYSMAAWHVSNMILFSLGIEYYCVVFRSLLL